MQNPSILLMATLVLIGCAIGFSTGHSRGISSVDPLDVNRDGEANIVDLSVLAAELNARGQ